MLKKVLCILLCLSFFCLMCTCGAGDVPDSSETGSDSTLSSDTASTDTVSTDASSNTSETERLTSRDVLDASQHLVGLCDQKNSRIIVCDLAEEDWTDDNAVVWEFKHPRCSSVAGLKLRESEYWGGLVVICCYGGGAMIISFETKEILYFTTATGSNPHSVELLPNGCFVVASSTDNNVRIYAPGEERPAHMVTHTNAHGVLWDPLYEVLWISGGDEVSAYGVLGTAEEPELALFSDMVYRTPESGLHDLAPVYGSPEKLFVTCNAGIMVFDKETEQFSYSYPGSVTGKTQTYAPGCGSFGQDNVLVFTTIRDDTNVYNGWCTDRVGIYVPLGDVRGQVIYRIAPDDAYYKVRVWESDYQ